MVIFFFFLDKWAEGNFSLTPLNLTVHSLIKPVIIFLSDILVQCSSLEIKDIQ
jgi:hypothetical protein